MRNTEWGQTRRTRAGGMPRSMSAALSRSRGIAWSSRSSSPSSCILSPDLLPPALLSPLVPATVPSSPPLVGIKRDAWSARPRLSSRAVRTGGSSVLPQRKHASAPAASHARDASAGGGGGRSYGFGRGVERSAAGNVPSRCRRPIAFAIACRSLSRATPRRVSHERKAGRSVCRRSAQLRWEGSRLRPGLCESWQ